MPKKLKPWGDGEEYPEAFSHLQGNLLNHFRHGNADAVRAFLTQQPQWLGYYYFGESLLHKAATYDYPDVLMVLVELGLDVNTPKEQYPWGALSDAVLNGYVASARRLLELGANTVHQHRGLTFSCGTLYAVDSGNFEMVKLLVDHAAPVDTLYDDPPRGLLTAAIENGHKEIADYLRSKGALTDEEIKARTKATSRPGKPKM
jgi:ankyrin repeat protein